MKKLTSGFGALSWNWIMAIFAFSMRVGPPAATMTFWCKTTPSMSSVSSMVPPTFFTMRMSLRSTLDEVGVTSRVTAATAIGAKVEEYWDTIFFEHESHCDTVVGWFKRTLEFKEVLAARSRLGLSLRSTGVDISVRYSTAFTEALRKASAMMVGCMPFCNIFSAAPKRLPARTTTDVVPSPASISWAADKSTSWSRC